MVRCSWPDGYILSDEEDSNKSIIIEFNSRLKLAVKIYPNPTLGKFHIMVNNPISEHVMVTYSNMIGEIIWSGKVSNNVTFNQFTSLPKGVYLLKVENELNSVVEKLIIN